MATPEQALEFFKSPGCHSWSNSIKAVEIIRETEAMIIIGKYSTELKSELLQALLYYYRQEGVYDGQGISS